jgi:hypothetical protein
MPAVIHDLEDAVDGIAGSGRWVRGGDGLVAALKAENFDFKTFEAQKMMRLAARNGETATVKQFLQTGVTLKPMASAKPEPVSSYHMASEGWLSAASRYPDTLKVLIGAGAGKTDQADKDSALKQAAQWGEVKSAQALIAYGANARADGLLINAASSAAPEMVREILRYHPMLEAQDSQGRTALFAAVSGPRSGDEDVQRAECVRLLLQAGASVKARDYDGNTPLHGAYEAEVAEELLKGGADVNARNKNGETPIFAAYNAHTVLLYVRSGADLSVRDVVGHSVEEVYQRKGPQLLDALHRAMAEKTNN